MDKSEIKALVRLLEDDDPVVASAVDAKIQELGAEVFDELRLFFLDSEDINLKNRLTRVGLLILKREFYNTFLYLKQTGFANWGTFAFLMSKLANPFLEQKQFEQKVNNLIGYYNALKGQEQTILQSFKILKNIFFDFFTFLVDEDYRLENFSLLNLIEAGHGNKYVFTVLYLVFAQILNVQLYALNPEVYPFVLYRNNEINLYYINVLNGKFSSVSEYEKHYKLNYFKSEQNSFLTSEEFVKIFLTAFLNEIEDSDEIRKEVVSTFLQILEIKKPLV